ncbi:cls [Symbiodinium necroappetens]|uniref:Cls protein n=1 Tax=Symbiodinium necroappetens TaxID=1628268 RepID=A0A812MSG0_9DINO|nr:cls [Symbiodinium necroappetens]
MSVIHWLLGHWAPVSALLYLALAIAVSVHVLLAKRDVRATVAWVGLAWLSPVIGAVAYLLFGINRINRKASRLLPTAPDGTAQRRGYTLDLDHLDASAPGGRLVALARLGENLSHLPIVGGNRVEPRANGDDAYPDMLAAIRDARHSIALSSYIFRDDAAGAPFVAALAEAQARGVAVRVLLDGMGAGYLLAPGVAALRRRGVPTARFLHSLAPWRMPYLNLRSHRKILVVDGRIGFTGGLNIGSENLLARAGPDGVQDLHFRIEGPVVRHLMDCFAEDWAFTTGEQLAGERWFPELAGRGAIYARGLASGPDESVGRLAWTIAGALGRAERSVRIVTPYFLPEQTLMAALTLAALRGVAVDIVIPARGNHRVMDWAAWAQHDQVLEPGCRLHLAPPPFDHSKLMTVDGRWALFGSANWDARSLRLNFEFNVECYSPELAGALDARIDKKIAAARPLSLAEVRARPLPVQIRDGVARLLLPYL